MSDLDYFKTTIDGSKLVALVFDWRNGMIAVSPHYDNGDWVSGLTIITSADVALSFVQENGLYLLPEGMFENEK